MIAVLHIVGIFFEHGGEAEALKKIPPMCKTAGL
jgi:hypothetical protein